MKSLMNYGFTIIYKRTGNQKKYVNLAPFCRTTWPGCTILFFYFTVSYNNVLILEIV